MSVDAQWLAVADRIGSRLCRDAHWSEGRCCWFGPLPVGTTWVYRNLGSSLYNGASGIGLFLAHLASATGDKIQARHARAALEFASLNGDDPDSGLFSGTTGIAYALLAAGLALGSDRWNSTALSLLLSLPLNSSESADIISGLAGRILAAVWVSGQRAPHRFGTPAQLAELNAKSVAFGRQIVRRSVRIDSGVAWPGDPKSEIAPLLGFAHGVSGIVAALAPLAVFGETVQAGLIHETSRFDDRRSNWPDYRIGGSVVPPTFMSAWCHGAAGIALANLSLEAPSPHLVAALDNTMESIERLSHPSYGNYSLCHGACGNADILLSASRRLNDARYADAAAWVAAAGRDRIHNQEAAWPCGVPGSQPEPPQLMTGTAGIGMFYLRMAQPQLESVLDLGLAARFNQNRTR